MSETTLYRKYRPAKFSEVLGQEPIIKTLEAAIKEGRVAHAYLFAGSRGTGKTTVARLFAQAVGCAPEDLYEIDAASNRGIDEIRELREAVHTRPFRSPYKVYIIDEAHMLTKEAFNALLKTLEEPPDHVIFILATTEAPKLPETIVSRCQTFSFRRPSFEEIKILLNQVAVAEGRELESEAADILALLGDGSFRDALGAFQKVLTTAGKAKKISAALVEEASAAPRGALVDELLASLLEPDAARGLESARQAAEGHQDFKLFLKLVARKLRLALLFRLAPELKPELTRDLNQAEIKSLETLAAHPRAAELPNLLRLTLAAHEEIDRAFLPQLPLELLLARLKDGV